jgi:hypothetical protein
MKTTTLILAALMFGILSTSSINAGSISEKQSNNKQLKEKIESLFQNIPLQDLMVVREKCSLEVNFEINSNNELANIQINGKNSELVRYALNELMQAPIKVNPSFEHKKYSVNILCILR